MVRNNFFNFVRHMHSINLQIIIYASKEIACILKGDCLAPSFNPETMSEYLKDLQNGNPLKALPMGAYEYDCCVEYLKKIRRHLFNSRENFKVLKLVFNEFDTCQTVVPPLEDCLEMVAKKVGFKLTDESIESDKYVYTLESVYAV